jgi:hypothetical protein
MIERREDFRFTMQTGQTVRIAGKFIWQDLDGDFTFQLLVFCAIDFTEPTLT